MLTPVPLTASSKPPYPPTFSHGITIKSEGTIPAPTKNAYLYLQLPQNKYDLNCSRCLFILYSSFASILDTHVLWKCYDSVSLHQL